MDEISRDGRQAQSSTRFENNINAALLVSSSFLFVWELYLNNQNVADTVYCP